MFINPLILYGLGLAIVPVLLHFLMRAKPKKLMFPALQLIQQRKKTNSRRMKLRHFWLLLMRVLILLLLVLAIMRPSLPSANYGFSNYETGAFFGIGALVLVVYFGVMWFWKKKSLPKHQLQYRRTLMRSGSGIVAILLLLLLVAFPYYRRLSAELNRPDHAVSNDLPVAGLFLFDTSLSMEYRQENKTRLERAQEIALEHLSALPQGSRIAVADNATESPIYFQADLLGAKRRIEQLKTRSVSFAMNDRIQQAIETQEQDFERTLASQESVATTERQDRFMRAIYIFTDLATHAWEMDDQQRLQEILLKFPRTQIYLIDVGVTKPSNRSVVSLSLSKQTVAEGTGLVVRATVALVGNTPQECTAELSVINKQGKLTKHGLGTFKLKPNTEETRAFSVEGLTGPIAQGEVRLISSDPLGVDDVRYFTVRVQPPPQILVVADQRSEADEWIASLAPEELVRTGRARYRCRYVSPNRIQQDELSKYVAVCLLNVTKPTESVWKKLDQYVTGGGGLFIATGTKNIDPVFYNTKTAQKLMPAELDVYLRFSPPEYFDLSKVTHPLFNKFEEWGGVAKLASTEINRYWRVKPGENQHPIVRYSHPKRYPALLEQVHGDGRVLLLTTAVTSNGWNDLTRAGWSYPALTDQMMQYAGRELSGKLNFETYESIYLTLDPAKPFTKYLLRKPGLEQLPGEIEGKSKLLHIKDVEQLGHYEIIADEDNNNFKTGFSLNMTENESDLRRIQANAENDYPELDKLLGDQRYQVTRSIEQLEMTVTTGRLGQEMFPFVITILLIFFCGEHLVANYFYEEAS